jgi:hypothetical protein
MAVQNSNFNTLIAAIDTKAQSLAASTTDPKDLVFLGKTLEALNVTATVSEIIAAGDTKVAAVTAEGGTQVGLVTAEGNTQVAAVQAAGGSYATSSNLTIALATLRNEILVTVAGGLLVMDGAPQQALKLTPSVKYRFDQSDASNATHPLKFSATADGTHASGTEITDGVAVVGTAGSAGAYVEITLEQDAVETYYYCGNHSGMGGTAYSLTVSGGGGAGTYDTPISLDHKQFGLGAQSVGQPSYLNVTDLNNYSQSVRLRGLDTASKAYAGINCMTQVSSGGNMQHSFILLSADQTTGAITLENCIRTHNNTGSTSDYSTMVKTSDEWTGRYSYSGNIPRNGSSHTYGYDLVRITGTGQSSQVSQHTNQSSLYPAGNDCTASTYVLPNERRAGGAVKHTLAMYDGSYGHPQEFNYGYNSSASLQFSGTSRPFTTSMTSGCEQVTLMNQWDVTNVPYYTEFMSLTEGLYARRSSGNTWSNLGSVFGLSTNYQVFFLSNGGAVLRTFTGDCHLITSSGAITQISQANVMPSIGTTLFTFKAYCWNVGTDEWLQALPSSRFLKFKINPTTGEFTSSNTLSLPLLKAQSYDLRFNHKQGFWSEMAPGTAPYVSQLFTYGTENASGAGYGKSKLFHVGADQISKTICAATYDIADLVSTLAY